MYLHLHKNVIHISVEKCTANIFKQIPCAFHCFPTRSSW